MKKTGPLAISDLSSMAGCHPLLFLLAATLLWVLTYANLTEFAAIIITALPLDQNGHLADSLRFLIFEAPKVLMLLTAVVMVMGMINSWFTPERTRAMLAGKREGVGNMMAATLGIVTPFCSCSAVPLFIGFVQAGVPLGITFSFLIAAPMVNEVALTLLFALLGWKVALLYLGLGLSIAIMAGWVIGRLHMEAYLEDWVRDSPWWTVPAAILIGVPMYSNAAGIIPIVEALLAKGAALGTVLAFMMSVIALSFPEMVILRKVLKLRLIALFIGVVASGILLVGCVFNMVL